MGVSPHLRLRGGKDDSGEGDSMLDSASAPNSVISESESRAEEPEESDGAVHNEDALEKVEDEELGSAHDSEESKDDAKEIPDPDSSDLQDSFRSSDRCFFFFFTLVTGPRRSLSLELSDTRVYEPQIRARLGTTLTGARRVRCWILDFEPSLDALSLRSDVISSIKIHLHARGLALSHPRCTDCSHIGMLGLR